MSKSFKTQKNGLVLQYITKLEVLKHISVRNKEIICIQKYPNQVVLARYSCSMIKPCQFSHYTSFWSVLSLYRNQRVILTNKYVVRCNFSKVPSQILKSFRIDNFPHLLFAYVVSKNQLPASYVKEAMA